MIIWSRQMLSLWLERRLGMSVSGTKVCQGGFYLATTSSHRFQQRFEELFTSYHFWSSSESHLTDVAKTLLDVGPIFTDIRDNCDAVWFLDPDGAEKNTE